MFVNHLKRRQRRRGVILLVVISLLTLFAVVGLSFLLYSEGSANSARIWREARQNRKVDLEIPPLSDDDVSKLVGELVYGVDDKGNPAAVESAWYGHDVASAMYSWKQGQPLNSNLNTVAYGGPGLQTINSANYPTFDNRLVRFAGSTTRRPEYYPDPTIPGNEKAVYVPKNADYTYPDLKDFYLAAIDPTTGRVLAPSFHRDYLFNWAPNSPDLQAANLPTSRFRTLRPISAAGEHPDFPRPLPNYRVDPTNGRVLIDTTTNLPIPDGSYGDVENLPNKGFFHPSGNSSQNRLVGKQYDSFWMDVGFEVREIRGKKYKALIAPLILDLDGRLNINVAGSAHLQTDGTYRHESNQGWGPWEMNLGAVMNGTSPVGLLRSPTGTGAYPYGRLGTNGEPLKPYEGRPTFTTSEVRSGTAAPPHSDVDFDGSAVAMTANANPPVRFPHHATTPPGPVTQFQTLPEFASRFGNGGMISASRNERKSHPAFFNPYYFNSNPAPTAGNGNRTFSLDNIRYLNAKYDFDASIAQSDLHRAYPDLMQRPLVVADPRNRNPLPRWQMTVMSNDHDRVGYMPWADYGPASTFVRYGYPGGTPVGDNMSLPQPQAQTPDTAAPDPKAIAPSIQTDYTADWQSKSGMYGVNIYPPTDAQFASPASVRTSAIAPLDLTRPLVDYRTNPADKYETANNVTVAQAQVAVQDRQLFARDIFDRLVMATFGLRPVQLNQADPAAFATATGATYQALQWLAQLAVNMVDYIDGDDYMTPFLWNIDPMRATDVVYGTETPRLVFNEIHTRWANDPLEITTPPAVVMGRQPAMRPFHHEIYLELMNPLTVEYAPATPPENNPHTLAPYSMSHHGGAILRYNIGGTAHDCYQLVVADGPGPKGGITNEIRDWKNVDGRASTNGGITTRTFGVTARDNVVVMPFARPSPDGTGAKQEFPPTGTNPFTESLGFFVIGPKDNFDGPSAEPPIPLSEKIDQLKYDIPLGMGATPKPKAIYLRRLLCPHLPPSATNPYVTVDYLEYDRTVYDDRRYNEMDNNQMPTPGAMRVTYSQQYSWGRLQPYAGFSDNPIGTDGSSHLIQQQNQVMANMDERANHSFFFQNNQNDRMNKVGPFDWLRHLDRVPINPMELLHVSAYKPHELTQEFIKRTGGGQLIPNQHLAQWFDFGATPTDHNPDPVADQRTNQLRLSRFLGLVSCRSRMFGIPSGGRVPGRINVNSQWGEATQPTDRGDAVLQAAFDPSDPNLFTTGDIRTLFTNLVTARSSRQDARFTVSNRIPWDTDKPLLGAATPAFQGTHGVSRTLLRPKLANLDATNAALLNPQGPFPNAGATYDPTKPHPYHIQEPLTKAMSNFTTRSNCFLFICTVGYFEYDETTRRLGKEIGNDDGTARRDKFMAVIDRTNLSIDPTQPGGSANTLFRKAGPKPVTYSYEPMTRAGLTIPNTVTDYDFLTDAPPLQPDGTYPAPGVTITVRVPTAYNLVNGNLTGFDDGGINGGPNWVIVPQPNSPNGKGTYIQLDTGDNAETVEVIAVNHVQSDGATTDTDAGGGEITFRIRKPHRRGAMMLFGAKYVEAGPQKRPIGGVPIVLGNPGPQAPPTDPNGFDYRREPYNAVVPYVVKDIE